jgi:ELWxxDGT repeat protein
MKVPSSDFRARCWSSRIALASAVAVLAVSWPAQATLLADINSRPIVGGFSSPGQFVQLGTDYYFGASLRSIGRDLYRTDGTAAGTALVKDITEASFDSLTVAGSTLFFQVQSPSGTVNNQLWKSDGTTAGTVLVAVVSSQSNHVGMGGVLYFVSDGTLYRSDGTAAGTVPVSTVPSGVANLTVIGGRLWFAAAAAGTGTEVWTSDGTAAGTQMVKDINPGTGSSSPTGFTEHAGMIYFSAIDGVTGREPWKSDGTDAGTMLLRDIRSGSGSSTPVQLEAVGSTLFFRATEAATGSELWKTDGTTAGTVLVKDILPGSTSSFPTGLTSAAGLLLFSANDGTSGGELWSSDGTNAGTMLVKDIRPGSASSSPSALASVLGLLLFSADDGTGGSELWRSDGTPAGTILVKDLYGGLEGSSPSSFTEIASGDILFSATLPGVGTELCKSDGTTAGTGLLLDLDPSPPGSLPSGPGNLVDVGGTVFFQADEGFNGRELWKTDGTTAGTVLVKDITPGSASTQFASVSPTAFRNGIVFTMAFPATDREPWISDGTAAGTMQLKDISPGAASSDPGEFTVVGGAVLFFASDPTAGRELWKSDGTAAGTVRVADINPGFNGSGPFGLRRLGNNVVFAANSGSGYELWRSDGTAAGTVSITSGISPSFLTVVGSTLYFVADTAAVGRELWKSDGTAAGTVLVRDSFPLISEYPNNLTAAGDLLFFVGIEVSSLLERLWRSDGTTAGTFEVNPTGWLGIGPNGLPRNLAGFGDLLLFQGSGGNSNSPNQLFKSDGTVAGTTLLKELWPQQSSEVRAFRTAGSRRCFFSGLSALGNELWATDGTTAGTSMVQDINPGPAHANAGAVTLSCGKLLFAADDGTNGSELWIVDPPGATAQSIGTSCGSSVPTLTGTDPVLGSVMTLNGAGSPAGLLGYVILGVQQKPPLPAPFSPPCELYFDLANPFVVVIGGAITTPTYTRSVQIPNSPRLIGGKVVFQTLYFPTTVFPLEVSNGVLATVGL